MSIILQFSIKKGTSSMWEKAEQLMESRAEKNLNGVTFESMKLQIQEHVGFFLNKLEVMLCDWEIMNVLSTFKEMQRVNQANSRLTTMPTIEFKALKQL